MSKVTSFPVLLELFNWNGMTCFELEPHLHSIISFTTSAALHERIQHFQLTQRPLKRVIELIRTTTCHPCPEAEEKYASLRLADDQGALVWIDAHWPGAKFAMEPPAPHVRIAPLLEQLYRHIEAPLIVLINGVQHAGKSSVAVQDDANSTEDWSEVCLRTILQMSHTTGRLLSYHFYARGAGDQCMILYIGSSSSVAVQSSTSTA